MENDKPRVSRPPLSRTGPKRDFADLLDIRTDGSSDPAEAHGAKSEPNNGAGNTSDVLDQSVRLAYSVVRDQIRQGQRAAQRLTEATSDRSSGPEDMLQRMLRLSTDFGSFVADFVESSVTNGAPPRDRRRKNGADSDAASTSTSASAIAIEVHTAQPSRVILDLASGAPDPSLAVPALYSLDGDHLPLTNIRFERGLFHVHLPDVLAPGTYTGVVVDRNSQEPCGTLSITLFGPDRDPDPDRNPDGE